MNAFGSMSRHAASVLVPALLLCLIGAVAAPVAFAQTLPGAHSAAPPPGGTPGAVAPHAGGEASLKLPDLGQATFLGVNGRTLLMGGLVICVLGLVFGLVIFTQ